MADRGATGARLDHAGLAVTDLKAAVTWFCDVFGLVPEVTLRVEALDLSIEMLVHPAYRYRPFRPVETRCNFFNPKRSGIAGDNHDRLVISDVVAIHPA